MLMLKKQLVILALPFLFAGAVHGADRDIAVSDLPTAVTDSIKKTYPNAKIVKAEEETKGSERYYEVKIHEGQTEREIYVRPDGTITHDELDED
jgi:hypothetical protein